MPQHSLLEMLEYKRPEGSDTQKLFCEKYLEPYFGAPDEDGNYTLIINEKDNTQPVVCFTAHHDTVHREGGMQTIMRHGDDAYALNSDCLGADCTTGVWLILGMIEKGIPGVYVIHSGEEVGCLGSSALVKTYPYWLQDIKAVISFDRKGKESIITHQMGLRTCSNAFAESLADALSMPMKPDSTGAYTDSNEYRYVVSECTNLSVGYYNQHSAKETQDVFFAYQLLSALTKADWSKLVFERDNTKAEQEEWYEGGDKSYWPTYQPGDYAKRYGKANRLDDDPLAWDHGYDDDDRIYDRDYADPTQDNYDNVLELVKDFPEEVASLLDDWGVDAQYLLDQLEAIVDYKMQVKRKYGIASRKH